MGTVGLGEDPPHGLGGAGGRAMPGPAILGLLLPRAVAAPPGWIFMVVILGREAGSQEVVFFSFF